ncbi:MULTISPECIES: glutamine-hydrolyzing carbamoyl-phosphate synthase small subunit [unclassified Bacteroides]|jgi:carbamoyl-phosphate synthase small subunit|uniref:glutamine-hydrolyzing carbamoyl-phosphate synthase small subunit n=1 Tax=unclassified Bacteroides TaxID=2646097 RepID=UPI000E7F4E75|nr:MULTISPECIES: glutamine-hydrolyzing carbamoyl-phosphate synthase small subunit [unclassified Bacteroides]RGN49244.1 carbamoyl-phosphate synthase (glutamine-hydrolyzing) small subunit [Bacteroides sp. OM05-12]RHR83353.1 carbamoyl-phosphate synthase (glutamine-hydrolyzing) small subunit [Bacteroides sp. AF16-49]
MQQKDVTLILDDGSRFSGKSFGYEKPVAGEVVFNTAMTGYPESLTDPSYAGQLMTLTYPLVGNYGVPPFTIEADGIPTFMESAKIHAEAIIVADYSEEYSHWNAKESLAEWLKREQIPGITGIDTRALTKKLREHGVMMGRIVFEEVESGELKVESYEDINYVDRVSCKDIIVYAGGESYAYSIDTPTAELNSQLSTFNSQQKKRVVLVDCGVKANIIRCLLKRGVEVIRVPWDYDFNGLEFDGLFISNGPGDPDTCDAAVQNIRKAMQNEKLPIFGICMGNQLLAKAGGASVYKLKYGHRSHNQPVRMEGTNRCFITSQNHGYAVDNKTLGEDWEPLFTNMNDGSNEGIRHKRNAWFSAQFHPEAASGPTDTEFLFDEFVRLL